MSQRVRYLTHPEVEIDPAIPVGQWHLNARGRARAEAFAGAPHLAGTVAIYASREAKAIDTAAPIAATLSLTPILRADMGENDRTATGFLPGPEFETTADAFFANPDTAIRGWETARAAQARIVAAAEAALAEDRARTPRLAHSSRSSAEPQRRTASPSITTKANLSPLSF